MQDSRFLSVSPTAAYDSWLTVGITGGDGAGLLSSVGIDWAAWTDSTGLAIGNGAVFMMCAGRAAAMAVAAAQARRSPSPPRQTLPAAQPHRQRQTHH